MRDFHKSWFSTWISETISSICKLLWKDSRFYPHRGDLALRCAPCWLHPCSHFLRFDDSNFYPLLNSYVFLIYSPLSDEEGIPHLLWAESWFFGIFQQQIFSHKSPTLLWVWLEGVRMAPISRRGHTMAHRANQGLNQRLFLLSMTTGSSLSTASQILIWGFVISQSSFPCQ